MNQLNSKQINIGFLLFLVLIIVFGNRKNTTELIYATATFAVVTHLFLTRQPIIFFTLVYHTLQASIMAFYAEFNNQRIKDLGIYGPNENLSDALKLSCIAIVAMAICIYYMLPKTEYNKAPTSFNTKKLILIYGVFLIIGVFANLIGQLGGLYQLLYKISVLKWCILFLIIYNSIKQKRLYFLIIIGFEILTSIFSLFSNFKDTLIVALCSFMILSIYFFKIDRKYFLIFGSISLVLIITWQSIKEDYRAFLSGGEQKQVIVVDFSEAYNKIIDLATDNTEKTERIIDKTIERISYIDYFAEAINYNTDYKSHTNGLLWKESILHIVQPRLFFPNKKAIDDSEKTMKYTGLSLTGAEQGTSISLGYIAESYIDYGRYLFFLPIALLGLLIGWLFKKLAESGIKPVYYWAFTVPFYFQFYGLEMASEKVLGSIFMYGLVIFIIIHFFKKHFKWLEK